MKKRVADIIVETLINSGIDTCFMVVGGGAMYLDNALGINDGIKKIFNHHEQASSMAAEAYARYSGRMAAVCVTSGPGATNAITGVMGAWQDSLPMIVLSGQVRYEISVEKSGLDLRYRGIQEFEIIPSVKNMTKYAKKIINPLAIKKELKKAIFLANDGRRGPVWLDVPQDIQSCVVEENDLYQVDDIDFDKKKIDYSELIELLNNSKRPCIVAGSGIRSANVYNSFLCFLEKVKIPVLGGSFFADALYEEHNLYYGACGQIGPRTGNFIVQNADVILVLGNSMGFRLTGFNQDGFAKKAKIIMVDIDENESKKPGLRVFKYIKRDLRDFFDEINDLNISIKANDEWIDYCNSLKLRFTPYESINNISYDERVNSYYFWKIFSKYEEEDSILALGNNSANSSKLQIGIKKRNQRVLTNYTCGSMGYDLPAAIGAAIASNKKVYCMTGDGSIMMNLQELQTIKYYDLPINIVIFENGGYGAIRQTSNNFFSGFYVGCTKETGISFPDFAEVAKTFGFEYIKCSKNNELENSIKKLINSKNRVLLEVSQKYDDPITPKVMSRVGADGKLLTPSIQDMYPFIEEDELKELMIYEKDGN